MRALAKRLLVGGSVGAVVMALSLTAALPAGAADGTGTMTVSPTFATVSSSGNTLVFTYKAAVSITNGELTVVVPAGWSVPTATTSTAAGYTTAGCGLVTSSGSTIQVTLPSLLPGAMCTVTYGDTTGGGPGANAPGAPIVSTFATSEKDTAGGTLTALGASPTVSVEGPGQGTMTVAPSTEGASATHVTLTFTYTAAAEGMNGGAITISVPTGWTAPSVSSSDPGSITTTCGGSLGVSGLNINITGVTLFGLATCTVVYGSTAGGGAGATAPATNGAYQFTTLQNSDGGTGLVAIASSPTVTVGTLADGTGTMTVSPATVGLASTGNTLTFTYTANSSGVSGGEITVTVPAGWSTPTTTPGGTGYTTSTCGTVAISTSTIQVTGVTLGPNATCTIVYGSKASSSTGSTAPSSAQVSTFTTTEKTTSTGTLTALGTSPHVTVGNATPPLIRIFGTDAIGTSIATSQAEFLTNGSAGGVVLARNDFFSDALAGGPLAALVNGPMLITAGAPISASLDPRVQAEIQRVLPAGGNVYILGGNLALSPSIDATLTGLGYHVVRLGGADEFQTAVLIAQQMGNPSTVFEATGLSFFDALSAVPAAIKSHAAILLTNGSSQSAATGLYIYSHSSDARVAIGGPLAAAGADPGATAVFGADLYATSAAVASTFFPGAAIFGAATAASFPDALGGGVFMATGGRSGALLLVNPDVPLPSQITPYLASLATGSQGYVFGGPLAVDDAVLSALQAAVG
ncbi:MAG: cell wall-binding repeat-containing protein [Acidimicrobiales bacterium]